MLGKTREQFITEQNRKYGHTKDVQHLSRYDIFSAMVTCDTSDILDIRWFIKGDAIKLNRYCERTDVYTLYLRLKYIKQWYVPNFRFNFV